MAKIQTKTCARCETEFDIDTQYFTIQTSEHPHPDDMDTPNPMEDRSRTLCGPCIGKFRLWMDPEADSIEDLHSGGLFSSSEEGE